MLELYSARKGATHRGSNWLRLDFAGFEHSELFFNAFFLEISVGMWDSIRDLPNSGRLSVFLTYCLLAKWVSFKKSELHTIPVIIIDSRPEFLTSPKRTMDFITSLPSTRWKKCFTYFRFGESVDFSHAMTELNVLKCKWIVSFIFKRPHYSITHPFHL